MDGNEVIPNKPNVIRAVRNEDTKQLTDLLQKQPQKKDLNKALLQASQCGQKEIVRALITAGADVNFKPFFGGKSAIFLASRQGHNEVVDLLLAAGAKKDLDKALLQASQCGQKDIVRALITAGADVNFKPFFRGRSAILLASRQGHNEVVDLLLAAGVKKDLDEALLKASKYGRKEIVRALISAGADVNFTRLGETFNAFSAISLASKNGHNEVVDMLLAAGAKKNLDEVLLQASKCGRKETVRALITAGANVNFRSFYLDKTAISLASEYGHNEVVDILLAAGAKEDLDEVLLQASECGRKETVYALITAGANVNFRSFHLDKTAISLASKNGHNEVVDILLAAGAKKDLDEVLFQASECGRKETVRALIAAGANVNFRSFYLEKTAISLASKNGHNEVVDILLAAGAKKDLDGALLQASEYGRKEILRALISAGADVNFTSLFPLGKTFNSFSAISLASKNGHNEVVDILLAAGAKDVDEALLRASECGRKEIVRALISAGADVYFIKPCSKTFNTVSPILLAIENGHNEVVDILIAAGAKDLDEAFSQAIKSGQQKIVGSFMFAVSRVNFIRDLNMTFLSACEYGQVEIVELLISAGANVNYTTIGKSPLSFASEKGQEKCVELLLRAGATVNHTDQTGKTPLIFASEKGYETCIELLLRAGARINHTEQTGKSPLIFASEKGNEKCVEVLLKAGARVNHTDQSGVSPVMTALKNGHKPVIKMLLLARAKVDPSSLFREMLDVIVFRHGYKMKLLDKLLQVDAKISADDVVSVPKLLYDLADYVLKTKTIEETLFCFLLILFTLLILQTTVLKMEMRRFTKLTFQMTGSDKVFLLCCHDVEQHPGPLSTVMNEVFRRLFSNLFLFYWGVKDKKEFTKLAKESPDKNLNANQQYAKQNRPKNWNDQYCFDDPSNPKNRRSYMPYEKCLMLLGMVESCYKDNKIPEECVLQELEAFTDKDDERLKALVAKNDLNKALEKAMNVLNEQDLKEVFKARGLKVQRDTSSQNATENVSMETDNDTDNTFQTDGASTSHTKTKKERLQDIKTNLEQLSKSLEEERTTTNRPGKRKAPGDQIDNEVLEDILEDLAAESHKKTKRDDDGRGSGSG